MPILGPHLSSITIILKDLDIAAPNETIALECT
jgi:hypothetical protein